MSSNHFTIVYGGGAKMIKEMIEGALKLDSYVVDGMVMIFS